MSSRKYDEISDRNIDKLFGKMTKRNDRQGRDPSIKENTLYILCNPMAPQATERLEKGIDAIGKKFNSKTNEYNVEIIKKDDYNNEVKEGDFRQNFWQLWARASNTLQDDEAFDGEHLCDPVMSGDFFETDKLKETMNFMFLVTNDGGQVLTFMTVRDLLGIEEILEKRTTETKTGDFSDVLKKVQELEEQKKEYLYIDGICSKERGVAMNLLKFLQKICCNSEYKGIKLAAITYVIKLYRKYGFKFDTNNVARNDELDKKLSALGNIGDDEAIFEDEKWLSFIEEIQGEKGITTTINPIFQKQFDRMKRYLKGYEGKRKEAYKTRMTKAFEAHDILTNGFNMKWDKPTTTNCNIQGGGKNSKKRTKKKARRRSKRRFLRGGACPRGITRCCDKITDTRKANCHFKQWMFDLKGRARQNAWKNMGKKNDKYHALEKRHGFNTVVYILPVDAKREKRNALENILNLRERWLDKYYDSAHCKKCDATGMNHEARILNGRELVNEWDEAEKNRVKLKNYMKKQKKDESRLKTLANEKKTHATTVRKTSNRMSIPKGFKVMTKKNTARRRRKKKTKKRSLLKRVTKKIIRLKGFKRKSKKKIKVKKKGTKKKRRR